MGCSASKLEDEEAVQLCKDRKNFVKQAIEQRLRFASGHTAYVQSLKRVSLALRSYIDGDEHNHDFYSDSCSTPPFTPAKKLMNPEIIRIPPKPSPPKPIQYEKQHHSNMVYYLRSGGNSAISVEESPRSPETVRVSSYYPLEHFGIEGSYFTMQSSPGNPSYFQSSPYDRPSYHPPPSPQNSQWDFLWNPFSSLENYGYPSGIDHEGIITSDDMAGLRRVREEEGIPDLEDEDEEELQQQQQQWHRHHHHQQEQQRHHHNQQQQRQQWYRYHQQQQQQQQSHHHQQQQKWRHHHLHQHQQHQQLQQQQMLHHHLQQQRSRAGIHSVREDMPRADIPSETNNYTTDQMHQRKEFESYVAENVEVTKTQKDFVIDLRQDNEIVRNKQPAEETRPGFTVYINRHPGSMSEVMRDIERQFVRICDSAQEVSVMLEASRTQYMSNSNELTAIKMLNPVTLFRTTSSRSTSSRFLPPASSCSRDDNYDSSSEYSDESCMLSGSHKSTLDRLYAWEKKLYEEVKYGERIRVAYEKKCMQLKRQNVSGEDHSSIDKTRKAARDLHTRIKISIHSIEAISRRIEKLRDEELHPQLLELIQGLARMWRTMADSHRIQKRAIDEAKLLLATPKLSEPPPPLIRLGQSASNLEVELRNWRSCLVAWITAQRSYVHALAGWLLRCAPRLDPTIVSPAAVRSPLSPPRSSGAPLIFNICIQWSRLVNSVSEAQAVDGLEFFAAGIASIVGQHREQATLAAKRAAAARGGKEEEDYHEGVDMSTDKIAEVAVRVVCAGMSVAVSSLSEFALCSMEGYDNVARAGDEEEKEDT